MAAGGLFARSLEASRLATLALKINRERLTARGRYALWLALAVGFVGVDTTQALVYVLFAIVAGPLVLAGFWMLRPRPRVEARVELPQNLTAGRALAVRLDVTASGSRGSGPLVAGWGWKGHAAAGLRFEPGEAFLECAPRRDGQALLNVRAERRGRYELPPIGIGRTDPIGLLSTRRVWKPGRVVHAYPRFFHMDDLALPRGRRYQPGGIALASRLGDSTEFVGTREYRQGDPLRHIHWRSWARRGKPVVKEFAEEYFSRVALVLDTFLPRRPRPEEIRAFEAAISTLASIADHMGRREDVVDIFLAGTKPHEIRMGRSLGTLDKVLEELACLEPSHGPAFEGVEPWVIDRLSRLTTVVAVVLDWDEARQTFLRRIRDLGVAVRIFVVRARPTRRTLGGIDDSIGPVTSMTPDEVESRIAASETAS